MIPWFYPQAVFRVEDEQRCEMGAEGLCGLGEGQVCGADEAELCRICPALVKGGARCIQRIGPSWGAVCRPLELIASPFQTCFSVYSDTRWSRALFSADINPSAFHQSHKANKGWNWDLNPSSPVPEFGRKGIPSRLYALFRRSNEVMGLEACHRLQSGRPSDDSMLRIKQAWDWLPWGS